MTHIETADDYACYHVKNGKVDDDGLTKFEKVLENPQHVDEFLHGGTQEPRWRKDNIIQFYKALAHTDQRGPALLRTAFHNHNILINVVGSEYTDVREDALHILHTFPLQTRTAIARVDQNVGSLARHGLVGVAKSIMLGSDEEGRIGILSAKGAVHGFCQNGEGHTVLQVLEEISPARKVTAQTHVLTHNDAACNLAAHDEPRLETMILGLPADSQAAIRATLGSGEERVIAPVHRQDPLAHLRDQLKTVHVVEAAQPAGSK